MVVERRRVIYSGHVQGVGFRATAHRLADGFAVGGHVRNLSDGRVEVVVEGRREDVSGFLESITTALGDKIHGCLAEEESPGDPPLDGFMIRA